MIFWRATLASFDAKVCRFDLQLNLTGGYFDLGQKSLHVTRIDCARIGGRKLGRSTRDGATQRFFRSFPVTQRPQPAGRRRISTAGRGDDE